MITRAACARAAAITAGAGAGYIASSAGLILTCAAITAAALAAPLLAAPIPRGALVPRRTRAWYRHRRKMAGRDRSGHIPAWLARVVRFAGRNRCAACHSRVRVQIDHIWPYADGGLPWLWNLALLCAVCNILKSDYHRDRRGRLRYHPFGRGSARRAALILGRERAQRLNPFYWLRVVIALLTVA